MRWKCKQCGDSTEFGDLRFIRRPPWEQLPQLYCPHCRGSDFVKRCIGFGDKEGKCREPVDTATSKCWCRECEQARRAHITKQLEDIQKGFEQR